MSWGVVGVVVFLTVSLIAFDLAWRLVKSPIDTLLLYAVVIDLAAAVALLAIIRLIVKTRQRRKPVA